MDKKTIVVDDAFFKKHYPDEKQISPKQIIEQARRKAQLALLKTCGDEIERICNAFSHDTGLAVNSVNFDLIICQNLGEDSPQSIIESTPCISHEAP